MTFSYLSNEVVGQQIIPAVWQGHLGTDQDPSDGGKYYTTDPSGLGGLYGQLQDVLSQQPNFNTSAATYTPTQETGTSVVVDNTNGLNPSATVTLSYTAETGATASTETSNSITSGVTESVSEGFPGIADSDTTFSISGTFSYTDGTSTSTSTSVTNTVEVPVTVPTGKVYEATIYYTQETLYVPYILEVYVPDAIQQGPTLDGVESNATFAESVNGNKLYGAPPSFLFGLVQQYNAAGQDSDLYSAGTAPNLSAPYNSAGVVTLNGTATMFGYGAATTKIYDVTPQTGSGALVSTSAAAAPPLRFFLGDRGDSSTASNPDQAGSPAAVGESAGVDVHRIVGDGGASLLPAVVDESVGVGVHRILGDGGESFRASKFDDWVEGGAGGDRMYLIDGGNDRAEGKGGDDLIQALGGGRHKLDGGDGSDHLTVLSDQAFNDLRGGAGDDLIEAFASRSILSGGQGDDTFVLDARSAGSVIVGAEGHDKLELSPAGRVVLERSGADLFLHTDGDASSYDRTADIVWLGFFKGDGEVNGLGAGDLAALFDTGATPVYSPDTGAWSALFGVA